jgi:hypothetical protein
VIAMSLPARKPARRVKVWRVVEQAAYDGSDLVEHVVIRSDGKNLFTMLGNIWWSHSEAEALAKADELNAKERGK